MKPTTQSVAHDTMEVKHLDLNTIEVGDRMRSLDGGRVDALAASKSTCKFRLQ